MANLIWDRFHEADRSHASFVAGDVSQLQSETSQEINMRTFVAIIAAALLAGCATAPATTSRVTKVTDQKTNLARYAEKKSESEFVGTSAGAPTSKAPPWLKYGHP